MTDQITIPRALLEQAREALEYHTQQTRPIQKTEHAILALRTELAKPSAPAQHDAPEVAALKAELDAAMKDAERYRWCVNNNMVLSGGASAFGWRIAPVGRTEWDRYIDAAIAKAEGDAIKKGG